MIEKYRELQDIGLIDEHGKITDVGRELAMEALRNSKALRDAVRERHQENPTISDERLLAGALFAVYAGQ